MIYASAGIARKKRQEPETISAAEYQRLTIKSLPRPKHSQPHRSIPTPLDGEAVKAGILVLTVTPVSTNNLFANAKTWRVKTARYRAWRTEVSRQLRAQPSWHVPGKVQIAIIVSDKAQIDIDNSIKGILDSLVNLGRIADDRNVVKVSAEFSDAIAGTRIEITTHEGRRGA